MAAPLKRLCHQAARTTSRHTRTRSIRPSFIPDSQCQASQQRCYQSSRPSSAATQLDEIDEDDFDGYLEALDEKLPDEGLLPSMAHAELEQHRELREMVRLAAWEMPLLSQLAQPYEKPDKAKLPLKWRYTTYFSEQHPASRKVVCEFRISDISQLAFAKDEETRERQILKLKKLCGARLNPQSSSVKMSCESFETQAQNKRYLADTINKLIAEAKDLESGDNFEDVPLDTRHHKRKVRLRFPKEWKMTEEKRMALEAKRNPPAPPAELEAGEGVEEDGMQAEQASAFLSEDIEDLEEEEEPFMVQARQPRQTGNTGQNGR
ncbi:uncharacterized protein MYCFIDRAFT_211284 [Pseudocercospora fijiensis CIRAD86]|uniref:Small ribosomal subunit protein mS35 mitochondrial conserved domain-containing protein n=1 Tax=Pseudocercospora fijiensis (strain CIRAD86) TaxID=383855 RepID=M2ZWA0_PSEFD|nr:uncharacterized protein MYCFIDRAFT_211284 [Pseudocercospora fijiensis CIRAD86]EME83264.1 hypothetical protein MYCFIDRAFT_211284 [Pseudocercospora fijiensis CIRAD86]